MGPAHKNMRLLSVSLIGLVIGSLIAPPLPAPALAQGGAAAPVGAFNRVGSWSVKLDGVHYRTTGRRSVTVTATLQNNSASDQTFDEQLGHSLLTERSGFRNSPVRVAVVTGAHRVPPGGTLRVDFVYDVITPERQADIAYWTFIQRVRLPGAPARYREVASQDFAVPSMRESGQPTPAPTPAPAPAGAQQPVSWFPRVLDYRYDQAARAMIVRVAFRHDASSAQPFEGYSSQLTSGDNSCIGPDKVAYAAADPAAVPPDQVLEAVYHFSAPPSRTDLTRWTFAERKVINGLEYCGGAKRQDFPIAWTTSGPAPAPSPAPAPIPAPAPAPSADPAFKGGADAYLQLRLDRVAQNGQGVSVSFTARNDQNDRRGIQYDTNKVSLIGSDGTEYRWDGNYYGRSAAELLNATVWLDKGQQAPVTYLFPGLPSGVTPARALVRNGEQTLSQFDLGGTVQAPPTPTAPAPAPAPAPTTIATFQGGTDAYLQLRLDSARRAGSSIVVTFTARNENGGRRGLQYNSDRITVVGSDGAEYSWDGNYYGRSPGQLLNETVWLDNVGSEEPVTYLFPNVPSGVTPVRVLVRNQEQRVVAEFNVPAN